MYIYPYMYIYIYIYASIYFLICWKSDCKKAPRSNYLKKKCNKYIEEELIIEKKKRVSKI